MSRGRGWKGPCRFYFTLNWRVSNITWATEPYLPAFRFHSKSRRASSTSSGNTRPDPLSGITRNRSVSQTKQMSQLGHSSLWNDVLDDWRNKNLCDRISISPQHRISRIKYDKSLAIVLLYNAIVSEIPLVHLYRMFILFLGVSFAFSHAVWFFSSVGYPNMGFM